MRQKDVARFWSKVDKTDRPEMDPPLPLAMIAQFEAIESDPETAVSSGWFEIRTVEQAKNTVLRIAQLRQLLAEDEAHADAARRRLNEQLEEYGDWISGRQDETGRLCRIEEERLAPWAKARLDVLRDGTKTVDLMGSKLQFRKAQDVYTIERAQFIAWAKATGRGDLVKEADPQPDRNAVKRLMALADPTAAQGTVVDLVDPATGQKVDGVTVTIGEDEFKVVTPEVDR